MAITVLLTGGAGYIGSHICSELCKKNREYGFSYYKIVLVDNLSNSNLNNYVKLRDYYKSSQIEFFKIDLRNKSDMDLVFSTHTFDFVIHLAGFKSVKKSVDQPLYYYNNNINSTLVLLEMMEKYSVNKLIFSSSATVYGDVACAIDGPITENFTVNPINPYGETKAMIEQMLMDMSKTKDWQFIILRYFNPVGADDNGLIGECSPTELPENLVPYILKVGSGELDQLTIFGNDYNTSDGTCIRDYLHVSDLANAHLKAMDYLNNINKTHKFKNFIKVFNLGTGLGYSVLNIVNMFDQLGIYIPYTFGDRRPGDSQEIYADPKHAKEKMGWEAKRGLKEMCQSSWDYWKQRKSSK